MKSKLLGKRAKPIPYKGFDMAKCEIQLKREKNNGLIYDKQ